MKRILYIDQPLDPPGGGQISLLTILKNIDRTRFDFKVFLQSDGRFKDIVARHNILCEVVPETSLYLRIKEYSPDIVHINSACTRYTFYVAFFSKLLKKHVIWHNRVIETSPIKERIIGFFVDRIVVISDAVGRKFGYKNKKVVKLYNPIDLKEIKPKISPALFKEKLGIDKGQKIIGIFSRVERWKGHEILIKAFSKLHNKNLVLLICGDGKDLPRIRGLVERLGLKNRVIFSGFVENVYDYMSIADVVVNPSVEPEPFGRVIVEAMALAKAVISTDMGGAREIIVDGYDGILTKPTEIDLAFALNKILTDDELYRKIARNAFKKAMEFDVKSYLKKLYMIYDELM